MCSAWCSLWVNDFPIQRQLLLYAPLMAFNAPSRRQEPAGTTTKVACLQLLKRHSLVIFAVLVLPMDEIFLWKKSCTIHMEPPKLLVSSDVLLLLLLFFFFVVGSGVSSTTRRCMG